MYIKYNSLYNLNTFKSRFSDVLEQVLFYETKPIKTSKQI